MTAQTAGFCGCRTGADGIWPGDAIDIVDIAIDTLWLFNVAMENPFYMEVFLGKSSVSLPFSIAMFFNFQMVIYILTIMILAMLIREANIHSKVMLRG